MKLGEHALKSLYQRRFVTAGRGECPPAEVLAELVSGELSGDTRESVARHLAHCRECSEELMVALAGDALTAGSEKAPAVSRVFLGWWRSVPLRIAASLVITLATVTFAVILWRTTEIGQEAAPVERGAAARSVGVRPADHAVLTTAPNELDWPDREGAASYAAELYDAEMTPIWRSPPLTESRAALPDQVQQRLGAVGRCYWRFFSYEGLVTRESALFSFRIKAGD